ncbi:TRAP transporter small permease [Pelagibacterium halotolerans]|uniref:TRAP transporter small permease n=1 Tax=Pelagibacterium halotolerans TaxID=531813 RepID=UPI00384F3C94
MQFLKTLDAIVVRIIQPILIVVGLLVAALLTVGIFSRVVLKTPIFGLEEIMLLSIMWFYMLGAALASRDRSHLAADFVRVLSKNPKVWRAASIVSTAISLGVAIMFVTWAWSLFSFGLERGQATPVFAIPWWVSQSSMFVASILFVIYLTRDLILEITGKAIQPGDPSAEVE